MCVMGCKRGARCGYGVAIARERGGGGGGVCVFFFFQAEDGIRDIGVTGVQTCALPICRHTFVFQGFVLYVQILAKKNRLKKELSKCVCD